MKVLTRGLVVVGLAAMSLCGCNDAAANDAPAGSGEAGASSSEAGAAGAGSAGGEGSNDVAAGAGGGADEPAACGPYALADLCDGDPKSCPSSTDDVALDLCDVESVERFSSDCGGSVVVKGDAAVYLVTYSFDAEGALTGVVVRGDVQEDCAEGGESFTKTYGDNCRAQGSAEDLCGAAR